MKVVQCCINRDRERERESFSLELKSIALTLWVKFEFQALLPAWWWQAGVRVGVQYAAASGLYYRNTFHAVQTIAYKEGIPGKWNLTSFVGKFDVLGFVLDVTDERAFGFETYRLSFTWKMHAK